MIAPRRPTGTAGAGADALAPRSFSAKLVCVSRPLSADTHPAAERVQLDVLRCLPPWRKLQLVADANDTCRLLCMAGLRRRYFGETDDELEMRYIRLALGDALASRVLAGRGRPG